MRPVLIAILILLSLTGCVQQSRYVRVSPPQAEIPAANLPLEDRQQNWGTGSCVHASTIYTLRWQGAYKLADWWRKNYEGGETASGIRAKLTKAKVKFYSTENADPEVLEYATRSRRGAIIWYFPNHCVTFVGFAKQDGREVAMLLDNNRIKQYIAIEKQSFLKAWAGYGGFALCPLGDPPPPVLYPAIVEAQ